MGLCVYIDREVTMNLRGYSQKLRALVFTKGGVAHWWAQRITAVLLLPLLIWLVVNILYLFSADIQVVSEWIGSPVNAILLTLFTLVLFHHAQLGLQVVIEDYIHTFWLRSFAIVSVKLSLAILCILCLGSIIKIVLLG